MGIVEVVLTALAGPGFVLTKGRMDGETVSEWKHRRRWDKLNRTSAGLRGRGVTDGAQVAGVEVAGTGVDGDVLSARVGRGEEFVMFGGALTSLTQSLLARAMRDKIIGRLEVRAAERIYHLAMRAGAGGALTMKFGERVSGGEVDYEAGVAAELAYRAVMADIPDVAAKFIKLVVVDGTGSENAVSSIGMGGLASKERRLGAAKVMLQVGLSAAVQHFERSGWK